MAQAKYEIRRRCPICGEVFQIRTIDAVYCSKQCSDIAYKRKKDREPILPMSMIPKPMIIYLNLEQKRRCWH